jgi:hypothetical protein
MPGGLIRKGIFNRSAASAISGVESWAKARDNDAAVMLRSCAPLAGFAKGTDILEFRVQRQQSGCGFLPNVRMERMKQSITLVLAFWIIASSASANLGADSERIEDAYGTIVQRRLRDDGTVSVVYTKGRYLYMVTFADQRSISESYSRANGTDLSEKEIAKFLKANSAAKWVPFNTGTERRFKTSDGSAEATYGILNGRPALTVRELKR